MIDSSPRDTPHDDDRQMTTIRLNRGLYAELRAATRPRKQNEFIAQAIREKLQRDQDEGAA
jgi:hypothetical protein